MLTRVIPLVCSPIELAEADVAVGKERAHPELAGERQGCTVVALRVSAVEGTGMSGDLAEEVEGPAGKGDRVVESVREQARIAHLRDDTCLEGLKGFLAFLQQDISTTTTRPRQFPRLAGRIIANLSAAMAAVLGIGADVRCWRGV
jgi:hypothetical protein